MKNFNVLRGAVALLILMSTFSGCGSSPGSASIVVENGVVWTGDDKRPTADAVAISGNHIVAVGSHDEIESWITPGTTRIDAAGGLVVPGFIDSHVHLLTGGLHLASVQLRDARTREAFVERIRNYAAAAEPGEWITGGDWDHENWGGTLPTRNWIDSVTPNNPVWINRLDGHMSLANSAALKAAGVDDATPDIDGGEIVRDGSGRPTGILKDNAMTLVDGVVPPFSQEQLRTALRAAMDYLSSQGVTTVHDMAGEPGSLEALRALHADGQMSVRVYEAMPLRRWKELAVEVDRNGTGDEWLRVGGLKSFVDGSLGSHTAAFFEPFSDSPADSGFFVVDMKQMQQQMEAADSAGLQLFIHAIGDRAIASLLDAFAEVAQDNGPRDRRWRIEHAQHLRPADIDRFASLGVIASMQPYHAIDDGRWAEKVIGHERAKTTYAFRSLLDAGATLAFGSDWFVAPPSPVSGIHAAVTRQTLDGANPGGWIPEQRISVEEALNAYTKGAAYAGFADTRAGVLEVGFLADIVVLDRNLLSVPPSEIMNATVQTTIVDGVVRYQRPK